VLRVALGVQQKVMAQQMHVSPQAWSGWENGRDLADPLVMARAALRYGFTVDWIYLGKLAYLPGPLADEIERRRPDLVLGAPADAAPSPDWDALGSPQSLTG
jgi:transcriptional regulator with XRE-family HTH domain